MNDELSSTICAIATAPGGALGIIRVSGPQTFPIVSTLCPVVGEASKLCKPSVHYTHLYSSPPSEGLGEVLDEAIVTLFHAPRSYTGEDTVEISCHGSRYILNKVLDCLVQNGCRLAAPGEFTMRAYLNGKLDLSQAEAVADLIASTNRATHQMAMSQLRGGISSELSTLRDQLLHLTSLLELELDFSDHEELEFADRSELLALAQKADAHITHLAKTFETGQALKQGIPVAIVGKTNVGKSTLLNALLKDDRAIVSDIHGTTRDTIEDTIDIRGITFRFIDTAGIRQTTDQIERIGIDRTYAAINKARIVLWLIDEVPSSDEIQDMQTCCEGKSLLIIQNKIDIQKNTNLTPHLSPLTSHPSPLTSHPSPLTPHPSPLTSHPSPLTSHPSPLTSHLSPLTPHPSPLTSHPIKISAKTGQGLDTLEQAIYAAADIPTLSGSDVIVTNARHYEALTRAHSHLQRVIDGLSPLTSHLPPLTSHFPLLTSHLSPPTSHLSPLSSDLLSEDLRLTIDALAEITGGQITPNEVLGNIFSHFCVGK